ncbi:ABC transporter ATP-binding protein [Glaciihabitans sp. INWT7]|uniref:ABC transporter ATP-binding protein n=1 Tax=Glaciihabitans sp. INWT7 TaxID=2596912 RepID=UPI00162613C1|nr:ABC transporter ATP-binding protein [Glaciihabitans sp. INWT7]QNE45490.1 ABC transporter ATP-binding protein [Glaciihabitans sp. INWT7]
MSDVVVRAEGLTRVYGRGDGATHALRDVSLEVGAGELVVLRGPSGSGKTTLLNLLGGLDVPTSGRVHLDGTDVTHASPSQWVALRRDTVGYVFQAFALIPHLSAAENIELPLRIHGDAVIGRDARVAELLALVGLGAHANQRPAELSGGQQQRVGIARALANRPRLLIADEPTGQLDSATAASMMGLLSQLVHREGVAAIVSTHDPKITAGADRVINILDGSLE